MSALLRNSWIVALFLLLPLTAEANETNWRVFRLHQLTVFQLAGWSFSGEVSWNPYFYLNDRFGIRGNIGGMLLNGIPENFTAAEYEALLSFAISKALSVEAGGGIQTWFQKDGGTSPIFSLGADWMFLLERRAGINAGYSLFLPDKNVTHEVKLGVTLTF
jgi:hypothetical protein